MKILRQCLAMAVAATALCACATRPAFEDAPPTRSVAPYQAARDGETHMDKSVMWGGMVLEVNNFEHHSEIEILAYPLDEKQRPKLESADQGRFIALMAGFADPATLPRGRFVTLIGTVTGDRHGPVRGEDYVWPEVDVKRLHLWPQDFRESKSRVSVGFGFGFGG
ncbi:MAG: Slp family lipoprotein [Rhodanobacteraceae bacterium]|nr:Slp family lipoprotein [Xanthomonadales bacterium]MCP5479563.1 Slp family lipoprotein [Rhodanobacteraceae bacterium]HPF72228.1 Slp family lipoprotein [Xanthomonadaceae bacterium]HRY00801.1 Slp family lipoprotein [Xanthomonadaceae bacterium]